MNSKWTSNDIPDLTGKVAVVTGANSGTGFEAARALAKKGATVVLTCRSLSKGKDALEAIQHESPGASVELMHLDLANLAVVRSFAEAFAAHYDRLDILCNNAGVMALPYRQTADGFEMQFGTNHLGHFALTGLLLPHLLKTPQARVVTMSSDLHKQGKIQFDDLQGEKSYKKWAAYSQSKLANLLFAYELQRKLKLAGASVISMAAHPGYAATNLQLAGPTMAGSALQLWLMKLSNLAAQSAKMGALPMLYAATAPGVQGGSYFGPGGFAEIRGHPVQTQSNARSHNREDAARLWLVSEELTGVTYRFS